MKLQVLGCHGGELPSCRTTCFLVDDVLALDAGALTSSLSLEQLCKVDDILVGHSHFDHVKDLPLMADLIIGRRDKPVTIHASRECARALREYMFNNALWPDFTRIPTRKEPVLRIKAFRAGSTFQVGPYTVQSIPVHHPVESCGFVITHGRISLAMSGDTGPTEKLWKVLNQTPTLKALLVETSFPNALQQLADVSGHLTPQTLQSELDKFQRNGSSVLVYHLKPAFIQPLKRELAELPVEVLELGDTFEF
ncbi:3',5'-cyclic-nucleotide phosphodiesterase [Archangium sp.]|uniref:3',5'-cyclic-nucleotide phosphodiesterase n=1 Tax=Archangium sp. TaxID=1872627 RepID=UPI002ED7FA44